MKSILDQADTLLSGFVENWPGAIIYEEMHLIFQVGTVAAELFLTLPDFEDG